MQIEHKFNHYATLQTVKSNDSMGTWVTPRKDYMNIDEKIKRMPKTELHLHTEGAIPLPLLLEFIHRKEPNHEIQTIDDLKKRLVYSNFKEFIMTWIWMVSFIQSEKDFETIVYHVLKELHSQNVKIAELFYSPFDYQHQKFDPALITEFMISGVQKAKHDFGIHASLIADVVRNHTYESAEMRFSRIEKYLGEELIGIGLGGSEDKFKNELFEDVFKLAKSKGFRVVAHAGEADGANSVKSAVEILNAERLGHGIRCSEDERLMEMLKNLQIPLEVCPTSNVATNVVSEFKNHPIRQLIDRGLVVTINSDDPTMFHTSVTNEFQKLHHELGFTWNTLKMLALNGVKASFLNDMEKTKMAEVFEREFEELEMFDS